MSCCQKLPDEGLMDVFIEPVNQLLSKGSVNVVISVLIFQLLPLTFAIN